MGTEGSLLFTNMSHFYSCPVVVIDIKGHFEPL